MTFDELRTEYDAETIGPQLWGLVVDLAGLVARRYPPGVYNRGASWGEASIEELAQETAVDLLLAEGQLHYIFAVAEDVEDVRRLLVHNVKRALYRRRLPTVVDRLMRRVRRIATMPPFAVQPAGEDRWITLADAPTPFRSLGEADLRAAAAAAHRVPRLVEREHADRASMVYTPAALKELIERAVRPAGGLTERDLEKVFEILLTAWLPTSLVVDEGTEAADADRPDSGIDLEETKRAVRDFVASLDDVEKTVFVCKMQGFADDEIAQRLSRSRPWVADRKKAVLDRIDRELRPNVEETLLDEAAWLVHQEASEALGETLQ